ncbi:hypothetical protein, partial [Neoroseomonas eburnea]
ADGSRSLTADSRQLGTKMPVGGHPPQQFRAAASCLARVRHSANGPSHAGDALQQQTETTMTDREARAARNQERSLAAFLAKKAQFDALLAELTQASADHFGADPETVLWGEAAWLSDATAKLKDIADQHFRRGEYDL